ncbi:MAG TPA: molybdenum cofactor biosynthesis protein MoaE [Pirellulaceae bacterium]|nr:molybdenum cofactor biosynthesis protein MoaE [Pirellulaceae bacterium]
MTAEPQAALLVELTANTIDLDQVQRWVASPDSGATVLFLGTTRRFTHGHETRTLFYECYPEMALAEMSRLAGEAKTRWALQRVAIVHRTGEVPIGEASVAIASSSPHRAAAFEAAQWLIEELKQTVPIWKQDHAADGSKVWSHPTLPGSAGPAPHGAHNTTGLRPEQEAEHAG